MYCVCGHYVKNHDGFGCTMGYCDCNELRIRQRIQDTK